VSSGGEGFGKKSYEKPKPVAIGDVLEVTVRAKDGYGDGIAKVDDFVIFVKGAAKGDTCKVKITDVKRTYAIAEKV
jgi:23S rRNA (uridine2552-2'-O)-methyltransferase